MIARDGGGLGHRTDVGSWLAVGLVVLAGCGTAVTLGGAAAGDTVVAVGAGVVVVTAAVLLLAGGWARTHPLALLAVTLPLPALLRPGGVRIAPALLATVVVVAAWSLRGAPDRRLRLEGVPMGSLLALLGAVTLSALMADAVAPAARELLSLALLLGLLVVSIHELTERPARIGSLALALAAVAAVSGVVATLQAVGVVPSPFQLTGTAYHRATLGFEWPNEAAMFLAVLLPFSVHAVTTSRGSPGWRLLAASGLVATLAGLTATFSRGSWLVALAAPAVFLLVGRWRSSARIWLAALLLVAAVDVASGGTLSARVAATTSDPLVGQRLALMLTGLLMFRENPILGVGPGGFEAALGDYGPQVAVLWDYVGSAHNTYIQMAAESGIFGLAALLAFLWIVLRALIRGHGRTRRDAENGNDAGHPAMSATDASLRRTALWAFATACLVGMVEWSLNQGVGQVIVLVAAMGLALETNAQSGRDGGSER